MHTTQPAYNNRPNRPHSVSAAVFPKPAPAIQIVHCREDILTDEERKACERATD